jgi:small-conductance mechanosensitive channel
MAEKAKQPDSMKKLAGTIGLLAFFVGIILAIVGGIGYHDNSGITLTLVIVGILVGVLNITGKEVLPLLIAAIALIVVSLTQGFAPLDDLGGQAGTKINDIVAYIAIFITPAAVISAVRAVWALARPN